VSCVGCWQEEAARNDLALWEWRCRSEHPTVAPAWAHPRSRHSMRAVLQAVQALLESNSIGKIVGRRVLHA